MTQVKYWKTSPISCTHPASISTTMQQFRPSTDGYFSVIGYLKNTNSKLAGKKHYPHALCKRNRESCVYIHRFWCVSHARGSDSWRPCERVTSAMSCPHSPAQRLQTHAHGFLPGVNPSHIWSSSLPAAFSFPALSSFPKNLAFS